MIRTYGLTHLSLVVKDLDRTLEFYRKVFGAKVYWREGRSAQVKTPGRKDVIAFEEKKRGAGKAGGKLLRRGEFAAGFPYAYVADPDGYEVEIWYE